MENIKTKNKLIQALKAYGLNEKQAKLYLTCLEFELITIQNLAEKSGIKRTTVYSLLEELEKIGIINIVKQKKKTYIKAEAPEILLENINQRREGFIKNLPHFKEIKKEPAPNPKFIFYRGVEGFKNFWRDLLNSGEKEWLISTSGKEFLSFVSESYVVNRIIGEKKRRGIVSRQIITDSRYAREIVKKDKNENRESRIVDRKFPLLAIEIIYGNKVAIISSSFENLLVVIDSEEVAKTHRSYFEMIWQFAEKRAN
ncbi:MAG: hypothetical protein A2V69_02365 [Candidatus Portnoybacteria bacterium RBG_13_40_8]|uniref:Transcription regulator TrmB N-terminal domain-containing protein n=1 Tax=Candidatus Portnoybacteria bacterium RBG_13_40_8 TaxID=1801990 RepID=A0A1G2F334_9BACT|nr:MAG: hypothetical protein A2V69_02365 [Candidatus Portnoybacteria bacterium RBG_13_40_8]OGZ35802.1 MAG: hypothetical protein A2V60_02970 [Candidatus Portnoybacteria bacterium RIFCSPHIGHO2_01_FULL_39_19]